MSNREYKSDVFSMLMEESENALQVFNGLNNSHYTDPSKVEYRTLENGISLTVRNDASFIVGTDINYYEHQSSYNKNMALRQLFYYSIITEKDVKECDLDLFDYKRISIPTPHFVVFYNGEDKRPEVEVQKLSDHFEGEKENPEIELLCTIYNINPPYNRDLMEKCPVLAEYTVFVERVRENIRAGMDKETALETAIDSCIQDGILAGFLTRRRNEVSKTTMIDMTFETRERLIRKHSLEQGREEGQIKGREEGSTMRLIEQICRKLRKGKKAEEIAEDLDENIDVITPLFDIAVKYAPDYDIEAIYEEYRPANPATNKGITEEAVPVERPFFKG